MFHNTFETIATDGYHAQVPPRQDPDPDETPPAPVPDPGLPSVEDPDDEPAPVIDPGVTDPGPAPTPPPPMISRALARFMMS